MSGVTDPPEEPVDPPVNPDTPPSEPTPAPPSSLEVASGWQQFYRLDAGAADVSLPVEVRGPPGLSGAWEFMRSNGELVEDAGDAFTLDASGEDLLEVVVPGPQDCVRVRLSSQDGKQEVVSPPFDVIASDAPEPAPRTDAEQAHRLASHASYVAAGTAEPGSPPLPFQDAPMPDGTDARLVLARDLARRGLTYASVNDTAKAVLLLLDVVTEPDATKTPIGVDAAEGRAPPLL